MSWSSGFHASLASSSRGWIVCARRFSWISGLDTTWQVSTARLDGHRNSLGGERHPGYVPAQTSVPVRTWQTSGGGFSLHINGISNAREALANLRPGSMVGVYAGQRGRAASQYERIDLGQFINATQLTDGGVLSPVFRFDFAPAWSALRRRPAASFANRLFHNVDLEFGSSTQVSTTYTAGDASLVVTSAAVLERQAGGSGIVKVTGNGGEDFYLEWSAVSGTGPYTLTVGTAAKFGSTLDSANNGNVVKNVGYLKGHPASILRRLLVSTGTADFSAGTAGDNGTFDVYPTTWGFGISRDDVDMDSLARLKSDVMTVTSSSGNYSVELLVEESPDNALDWLTGWIRPLGMFLRLHQGQFSAWAAQNPHGSSSLFSSYGITDDQIVAGRTTWRMVTASGQHHSSEVVVDGTAHTDDALLSAYDSAPVFATRSRDCTGILRSELPKHAEDVNGRCSAWDVRSLAELGGQWVGGWHARLGLGELTHVSTPMLGLFRHEQAVNGQVLDKAPAMVTAGPVIDILNARVWLGLTLIPES